MKAVLFLLYSLISVLDGYNHACPKPSDIQEKFVTKNFNMTKFEGVWYELAYHDLTQPIGLCQCMRSEKSFSAKNKRIYDNFSLRCDNKTYTNNLSFNVTSTPGFFRGHWPIVPSIVFPDTLVAVGVDNSTQQWRWVIEFQCVEMPHTSHILFTGINFYHRSNKVPKTELEEMFAVARKQGLGEYMDTGFGVTILNHTNCIYPQGNEQHVDKFRRFFRM